jgi:hypothetical protein
VGAAQARRYRTFLERTRTQDAGDLLLRQLEQSSANGGSNESGAGLLTMISDYGAQLGWRFEAHPVQADLSTVTTSAILSLKKLSGVPA